MKGVFIDIDKVEKCVADMPPVWKFTEPPCNACNSHSPTGTMPVILHKEMWLRRDQFEWIYQNTLLGKTLLTVKDLENDIRDDDKGRKWVRIPSLTYSTLQQINKDEKL